MDIVIPYRKDILDGLELKYALRSIEKNLLGWDDIILIGDRPGWYTGEHIPASDTPGRKEYNIYQKLLIACAEDISEDFIMWNDDHYMLKLSEIKYWHNGPLVNEYKRMIGGRYRIAIQNTLEDLPDALNYDIHVPIVYNKTEFQNIFRNMAQEVCIKSYYSNKCQIKGHWMDDLKIEGQFTIKEIEELIKDKTFFSTGTMIFKEMFSVLAELFPHKSQSEG